MLLPSPFSCEPKRSKWWHERERERIMFEGEQWVTFFGLGFSWRTIKLEKSKRERERKERKEEQNWHSMTIRARKKNKFLVFQLHFCSHFFFLLCFHSFFFFPLLFPSFSFSLFTSFPSTLFSSFAPHSSFFSPLFHSLSVDLISFSPHSLPPTFLF